MNRTRSLIILPPSHPHLAEFREAHRGFGERLQVPEKTLLSKILLVGAFYEPEGEQAGLCFRDKAWVFGALDFSREWDLPLTHDLEVTPANTVYGHDVLAPISPLSPTDVMICGLIVNPDTPTGKSHIVTCEYADAIQVSDFHSEQAWKLAPQRAKANLVFAFSRNEGEICGQDLMSSDYIALAQKSVSAPVNSWCPELTTYTMDVLIRADYAEELVLHNPQHRLARVLHKAAA